MKIVVEANIPFAKGLLDDYAEVRYLSPSEITADAMRDADALITRTRTRCDEVLLENSRCSMIASATIGLDHVDMDYCAWRGIEVVNAPGCNAPAVAQYVLSSIISAYGSDLNGLSLGIVGVGHVGSIVERWARQLGMKVLPVDPPRARHEGEGGFVSLGDVARMADIVTFHTPYTKVGADATHHLLNMDFVNALERKPMIINSARGAVTDTGALLHGLDSGKISRVAIDCWEHEPDIDRRLLGKAYIATPHIAGYSREGKIRATEMAFSAVARKFGLPEPVMAEKVPPGAAESVTAGLIAGSYDPLADTDMLRRCPDDFEALRNHYNLRAEVRQS